MLRLLSIEPDPPVPPPSGSPGPGWEEAEFLRKTCALSALYAGNNQTLTYDRVLQIGRCVGKVKHRLDIDLGYRLLVSLEFELGEGKRLLMSFRHHSADSAQPPIRYYVHGDPSADDCELVRDKFNAEFRKMERLDS